MERKKLTMRKKLIFSLLTLILGGGFVFMMGEILVRSFSPRAICYPRSNFSEKYGLMWPKNQKITNELPGQWKFIYTTNRYHNRGVATEISNTYEKKNVVILGDSYSFGQGVNDNEEYASIMAAKLKAEYNIINLSNSGWGLTQEIRRFYEFGQLYQPKVVILQFCWNDPLNNFLDRVTQIQDDRFVFVNSKNQIGSFKKYLSNSILQRSCLYNVFRVMGRRYLVQQVAQKNIQLVSNNNTGLDEGETKEVFYNQLLSLFAKDLKRKGIRFIMISVNRELDEFPLIKREVAKLDSLHYLEYHNTEDWFVHGPEYSSPEGHIWGKKAHAIIGRKLTEVILNSNP